MPLKEMDNPRGEGRKREERESLCFELRISFDFWPDLHCLVSGARTASLRQQSSSPLPPQCSHCVPLSSLLLWDWDPSCLTTGPSPPVPAQLRRTHENSTETWGQHTGGRLAPPLPRPPSPGVAFSSDLVTGQYRLPLQGSSAVAKSLAPADFLELG